MDRKRMKPTLLTASLLILLTGCGAPTPDPMLPVGELAIVGSYTLDNILLRERRLVVLDPTRSFFEGFGDSPEQAVSKGFLRPDQRATLQGLDCSLRFLTNHTIIVENLPAGDLTKTVSFNGRWDISVYRVFETYGYRIAITKATTSDLVLVKFLNADKPNPPVLEVIYRQGLNQEVSFRFVKAGDPRTSRGTSPSSPPKP
jgi:hypothetical protein